MTAARLHPLLQAVFRWGVLLTLCVAPTQWSIEPRPKTHLSPADLALAATAGVWFLDLLVCRDWRRLLRLPPWPHLALVAWAAVSALTAADRGAAVKELVQLVEYFLVGSMLFEAYLREGAVRVRQSLAVLGCATAVVLALALAHYFGPDASPLSVRGTFGNRNVLGGFLALALPLCFAGALGARGAAVKAACAALFTAGLTVTLSGAAYIAVAGAVVCLAALRGPRFFVPAVAALVAWQAFVLPRLPRENDLAHFQSVALYDGAGNVERRYPDWQAAYSMALTHPWLGVGPGSYQKHIGQYYDNVPRQTGPSEPDIQNLYAVLAASCGLPALCAFLALLGVAVRDAARAGLASADRARGALALGTAGALGAFAVAAVWHPLLVRGIGLPLVFLLALARCLGQPEKDDGL